MSDDAIQRSVLPIPDGTHVGLTTYDAKDPDTSYPPIRELRPPKGAPNVLVVLIDDTGFGASSAFGGPVFTPTAERLAANGLKFNRFHTTALCSPTRAALLSGRNHHSVGMGGITEIATSAPGYNSLRPKSAAPLAETLKLNGYSTAQFGKCHEVPVWQTSPMGPFDNWPSGGGGFEYFYGFIGGETNQYAPAIYKNTRSGGAGPNPRRGLSLHRGHDRSGHRLGPPAEGAHGGQAVLHLLCAGRDPRAASCPARVVGPLQGQVRPGLGQAPEEDIRPPEGARRHPARRRTDGASPEIPAWEDMPAEMKPILARQMEVYAGFLEHTDHHVGRLIDALADLEVLDDTLVYYIIGDNGASAEGTPNGTFNELMPLNGVTTIETPEFLTARIDKFGTPEAYNHYAVGWAHAMDTPYQWTKQVASHWGGTRNGTIVHWPAGFKARGEIRSQFSHVIDLAPTVLDAAGLPEPTFVHGIQQMPLHGRSMRPAFDDAQAPEHRPTQYFEMFVNCGIYHQGWTAVTRHSIPWLLAQNPPLDDDRWELYAPDDWTQSRDLAAEQSEQLARLQRLFLIEATKYNVLPLDDRRAERFNPDLAGRPSLIRGNSQMLFGGMGRLSENSVVNIKNKSHAVTAEITIEDGVTANGVIVAQGGAFGGFALYAKDGKPAYCYNLFGLQRFKTYGESDIPSGEHQVRMEFAYDGGGLAKGGDVTLYVDGNKVGEGRVEGTVPMLFSADETTDLGSDSATPVSDDYEPRDSKFNGRIRWVQLDINEAAEDIDHLITPEERLKLAMARQ